MAKKRTKAAKVRAAARLQNSVIHEAISETPAQLASASAAPLKLELPRFATLPKHQNSQQLWRFDPTLIYQDLLKTALASGLIVGILVLIYWLSF